MVEQFKDYYEKARILQHIKYEGNTKLYTHEDINDPLVWNVPIYDVVNRRYAAFSSLPEAIFYKRKDPKENGRYYEAASVSGDDFLFMCYIFRLVGSGINYKPKSGNDPMGSHGFGNFWIDKLLRKGYYKRDRWLNMIPDSKFADSKGYMLPLIKGGLKKFIQKDSEGLFSHILKYINEDRREIHEVVEEGNSWLLQNGYQRQNFVLCAFAMDLAEYRPDRVLRDSNVLVGSNARKCLKLIFPNTKGIGTNLEVTNELLTELCNITGGYSWNYDMEDVACDFIRYINNFQSPAHIAANGGITYKNNVCK